jgi:hypothetical protein
MRRPGYLRLRTAIASDTTHPMNVQPRNRLITRTDPTFGTLRDADDRRKEVQPGSQHEDDE